MRHLNSGFNDNLDHLEFDTMGSDGQAVVVGTTTAARAFRQRGGGQGEQGIFLQPAPAVEVHVKHRWLMTAIINC